MSTLTGNQIQNTYQGLLKLADSSTGITSNLQAVQDGLGNDTGMRITTNQLEVPNIMSFVPLKARYYGSGYAPAAPQAFGAGTQNIILSTPFYDGGQYSYSAISINSVTATTSSDTLQFALYTSQMINPFGLYPHTPVISGLTADTTTTGQKTFVFPSHISFSGYGAGVYWIVYKISNGGVTPTFRSGQTFTTFPNNFAVGIYGVTEQIAANSYSQSIFRSNSTANLFQAFSGKTTFDNPYSNTLNTTQSSTSNFTGPGLGFILHTVNA